MAAIIIPRRHLAQPQGRVEIAPEWAGIIKRAYVAGQSHDPASDFGYNTDPHILGPGPAGFELKFIEQNGVALSSGGFSALVGVDKPIFTVCLSIRKDSAIRWAFGDYAAGGSAETVSFGGRFSSATDALLVARAAGGANLVNTTLTGVASLGVNSHVFGHTPGSLGYIANGNGVYKSAVSAAGSRGGGTTARFGSGGDYGGQRFVDSIALFAVGSADLPAAQALDLAANPWQLFRADPIRIYSFPTGAITLNSLTMSAITQTTARATLGLTR